MAAFALDGAERVMPLATPGQSDGAGVASVIKLTGNVFDNVIEQVPFDGEKFVKPANIRQLEAFAVAFAGRMMIVNHLADYSEADCFCSDKHGSNHRYRHPVKLNPRLSPNLIISNSAA